MKVRAFAKINLMLGVGAARADGYHKVRTVLQAISLHDTLTFKARKGPFTIRCSEDRIPTDARNLIWKAAYELSRAAGLSTVEGVEVRLEKRIPAEAGLGGGSSNAAAAIRALARLWKLKLDRATLVSVAKLVGADVPFFLMGGAALGSGRGDDLLPLADVRPFDVVVIKPPFGVSTAAAYGWFDEDGAVQDAPRSLAAWPDAVLSIRNDLEPPVARRHPDIARLVSLLEECGAQAAAMSGSGSAVFGLFEKPAMAARAIRACRGKLPAEGKRAHGIWRARTLGRADFARQTGLL